MKGLSHDFSQMHRSWGRLIVDPRCQWRKSEPNERYGRDLEDTIQDVE